LRTKRHKAQGMGRILRFAPSHFSFTDPQGCVWRTAILKGSNVNSRRRNLRKGGPSHPQPRTGLNVGGNGWPSDGALGCSTPSGSPATPRLVSVGFAYGYSRETPSGSRPNAYGRAIGERHNSRNGKMRSGCMPDYEPGIQNSPFIVHHSGFTVHRSSFIVQHSPFSIQHSAFSIHRSAFTVQHSPFSIQHSAFSVRFSYGGDTAST